MSTIITRSRSKIVAKTDLRTRLLTQINNLNTDLMLKCITDFEEGTTYFIQFQLGCCCNSEINELSNTCTGLYEYMGRSTIRFKEDYLLFKNEFGRVIQIVNQHDRYRHLTYDNIIYKFTTYDIMIEHCCSNIGDEFFQCNIFKQETSSNTEYVLK